MRIDFTKMHGLGNDFIVFDMPAGASLPTVEQWRKLADRHTGIGFDQALVLEPPRRDGTVAFYRIVNSDGSEVEQCGNGARCIAAFVRLRGRANTDSFTLDSPGGLVRAHLSTRDSACGWSSWLISGSRSRMHAVTPSSSSRHAAASS